MHIKRIHDMVECLSEYTKTEIEKGAGSGCKVNLKEIGDVVDMLKDLCEAEYYANIAKAMEKEEKEEEEQDRYMLMRLKEELGEDEGKRYYDEWRYKSGRFAPRGRGTRKMYTEPPYLHMQPPMMDDASYWRDMDIERGRMYTDVMGRDGKPERRGKDASRQSRYGYSHDEYMKEKQMHPGQDEESKKARINKLDYLLEDLEEMAKETVDGMMPEEKQRWKVKLNKLINL